MVKKLVSGNFFNDVKRLLGWGYKTAKNRRNREVKKNGFFSKMFREMNK